MFTWKAPGSIDLVVHDVTKSPWNFAVSLHLRFLYPFWPHDRGSYSNNSGRSHLSATSHVIHWPRQMRNTEVAMLERRLQPAKSVVTLSLTSTESTLTVELALLRLQQANMGTVFRIGVKLGTDSTLKMQRTGNLFVHMSTLSPV